MRVCVILKTVLNIFFHKGPLNESQKKTERAGTKQIISSIVFFASAFCLMMITWHPDHNHRDALVD